MSDLGVLDYFLTKNMDKIDFKTDSDMDMFSNYDNADLMSSDFFDSILSLEKGNIDVDNLDSNSALFDNFKMNFDESLANDSNDDAQCETSTYSDSGMSSEVQEEMPDQILSDDELFKSMLNTDCATTDLDQQSQSPVPETVIPVRTVKPTVISPTTLKNVIASSVSTPARMINIRPFNKTKQVIKVQPMNVNVNSRSVLLPINIKDLKTIKIINANNLKGNTVTLSSASNLKKATISATTKSEDLQASVNVQRGRRRNSEEKQTINEDSNDSQYPLLLLTPEEKRLLNKDGIQLPCRYPLTKHEERELKRIRRKIRNKISAQDSRKRKKEYIDGLEEKVKQYSEEKRTLQKQVKLLQSQNSKLSSQLSKIQALVFKTGTSRAHPATCLMIVLLSVMLVTLPNLRNANSDASDIELNTLQQYVARRALLFSQQSTNEDIREDIDLTVNTNKTSMKSPTSYVYMNDLKTAYESHDALSSHKHASQPMKSSSSSSLQSPPPATVNIRKRYIEPDIDEHWPPAKKPATTTTTTSRMKHADINYTMHYQ